jgi:hypothetical protein
MRLFDGEIPMTESGIANRDDWNSVKVETFAASLQISRLVPLPNEVLLRVQGILNHLAVRSYKKGMTEAVRTFNERKERRRRTNT